MAVDYFRILKLISILALLGGTWLLLTSLASFGLGGYLAGRLRATWRDGGPHEIEFRDGIHGLLVWGLAVIIGALLAFATASKTAASIAVTERPAIGPSWSRRMGLNSMSRTPCWSLLSPTRCLRARPC